MKVLWKTLESEISNTSLKQHGFVDDGEGGNISLCGKIHQIGSDCNPEKIDVMWDDGSEFIKASSCKICLNIHNKHSHKSI